MQKSTKAKIVGGATAIVMACGLAVAGSSMTSAYFSDTNTGGKIVATTGSIFVHTDGNAIKTSDLDLSGLLPGEAKADTFDVKNTGRSTQDVHLSFDNQAIVDAINDLGTYASITIKVNDEAVFYSENLNDDPEDQGADGIAPLPAKLKIIDKLAPGEEAEVEFRLGIPSKATGNLPIEIPMELPYSVIATQPGIAPGA
jgi:hypothetical protein